MTDRDKATRTGGTEDRLDPEVQRRNEANQAAASRPPVDADAALDGRGHMVANPREGSAFEPNRTGSDGGQADRSGTSADNSAYVQNTDRADSSRSGARRDVGEGTARGTSGGRDLREIDPAAGEGSTFQPLAKDPQVGADQPQADDDTRARNHAAREDRPEGEPRGYPSTTRE